MRTGTSSNSWPYRLAALSATALLAIVIAGCPKENPAAGGSSGGGGSSTKMRIAVLPKGTSASFWQTVKAGAEAACKEENCEVIWQGPSQETDITAQIDIFQNQVTSGVNGIVLAATDANSLIPPVQKALDKGIPVVTIDSGLAKPISKCYIATDNVKGGEEAADALAKLIGDKGNVGVLPFIQGAASSDEREKGFKQGIAKHPNIHIVSTLYTEGDPAKALSRAESMFTAHPDIVGIFAANEPGGIGAANFIRQRKLSDRVKLVAYDASPDELKALQEGVIQALIVQDPFQMGFQGVKTVVKAIRHQPIASPRIDSGVHVVTKDNLNTPEVQKLLNP